MQNKNKNTDFKLVFKTSSLSPAPTKPSQASRTGYINTGSWSGWQRTAFDRVFFQTTEPGASLTGSLLQGPWKVASLSNIHLASQGRGGAHPPSQARFLCFSFDPDFDLTDAQFSNNKGREGQRTGGPECGCAPKIQSSVTQEGEMPGFVNECLDRHTRDPA